MAKKQQTTVSVVKRIFLLVAFCVGFLTLLTLCAALSLRGLVYLRESADRHTAAPTTGYFVATPELEFYVQETGPATSSAVVFVHGTGAWSQIWRETMTNLANTEYRFIAVDLPPFGYSEAPANARYTRADQGRRLNDLLDALKLERVILVGHSFGAGPTIEAAFLKPDRVEKLILVDAAIPRSDPDQTPQTPTFVSKLIRFLPFTETLTAATATNPLLTRTLYKQMVADPTTLDDEDVTIIQQPMALQGATRHFAQWLPALVLEDRSGVSSNPQSYAHFTKPTFLIWGEQDTITPVSEATALQQLLSQAQLTLLSGVGHIPHVEDPGKFTEALRVVLEPQKSN